jgi:hypothetical protein
MKLHQLVWCGDVLISVWMLLLLSCEIPSNHNNTPDIMVQTPGISFRCLEVMLG